MHDPRFQHVAMFGGDKGNDKSKTDDAFIVSNIAVTAGGTQLTATFKIAVGAQTGAHIVRVITPNGESSGKVDNGNTFTVLPWNEFSPLYWSLSPSAMAIGGALVRTESPQIALKAILVESPQTTESPAAQKHLRSGRCQDKQGGQGSEGAAS